MGLTRKMMSLGTLGAVDFRSDKERTAAYTRGAKREAKKQTNLMREMAAAHRAEAQAMQVHEQRFAQVQEPYSNGQLPQWHWHPKHGRWYWY